jgi:hypothetical protein
MLKKFEDPKVDAGFFLADAGDFEKALKMTPTHLKFIWNTGAGAIVLKVDGRSVLLQPGQVLCSTYLQKITFVHNASFPIHVVPAPSNTICTSSLCS